jgi:hypothetical protein
VIFKIDFEKAYDKVRWDFVQEVMDRKGFPNSWIRKTMCTIQGGRVCINVNGERAPFFRTFQGLGQGGLLSPLLFNLVVETLASLMMKASKQRRLRGVLTHLIPEGITHSQYANDTILIVEGDDASVVNMKFILYCFDATRVRIANMLNYQLGELPLKYLGIPISDTKLGKNTFEELTGKVAKRIPPWRGKQFSSGGRLILTNSCLSSVPIYTMGFYLLPLGTHKKMDSIRSNFFWRGAGDTLKYHMMRWSAVCRPKNFGGLGIINTQILHECLMTKWIWKYIRIITACGQGCLKLNI